ncbi:MAG TPA: TRAP transporter small permease [Succinivibrionaceae bacterium]|nr:TRAP transporter small permease [Succinivibrionaceae bacterium]
MYSVLENIFTLFQKLMLNIITLALCIMMCVIIVQVFTRYVIFYSLPWSEELSRYLFVFIVLNGINIAVSQEKLIKIDAVQNSIKWLRGRIALDIFHAAVGIIACVLIACYCTDLFPVGHVQKSPAMRIPMIIMYSIVFIGYLLSTIALSFKFIDKICDFCNPANKGVRIHTKDDIKETLKGE